MHKENEKFQKLKHVSSYYRPPKKRVGKLIEKGR